MNQDEINEAVKNCVRVALDQPNAMAALLGCTDELRARGWPTAEIQIVRATTIRILAEIHDMHVDEQDSP
jgi:hypothetical protein